MISDSPQTADRNPTPSCRHGIKGWLGLLARGMAMGIAELVPGVSGGTIAFVTGIYDELVQSLARFGIGSFRVLRSGGLRAFWIEHNLTFLAVLGAGMALSVLAFARLFAWLIDTAPTLVWAFFLGLILASIVAVGRRRKPWDLATVGVVGLVLGLGATQLEAGTHEMGLWFYCAGGFVAVSAWLLPAISGSFMLLVLGLYEPVLRAVSTLELTPLAAFASGCVAGILLMARLLHWLMQWHRERLLALLTGFMTGSLVALWPWRYAGDLWLPDAYEIASGAPAYAAASVVAVLAGMVALWMLTRLE